MSLDTPTHSPVLVVGASGNTGRCVLDVLLARGLHVRAFARHASALSAREGLERVDGDALDAHAVDTAMQGVAGVIVLLGPAKGSPEDLCRVGTANVIMAMRAHGVRRLACVTGAMIGLPRERLGLVYRFIESRVPSAAMADRRAQEDVVTGSALDWTILRPTRLTNGPASGRLHAEADRMIGAMAHVSRADVARFAVDTLDRPDRVGGAYTLMSGR